MNHNTIMGTHQLAQLKFNIASIITIIIVVS